MLKKYSFIFCSIIILFFLSGCGVVLPPLNPVISEDRSVAPSLNLENSIVLKDSMVWYNKMPPTRGIKFPSGIYQLEAEDHEYYYFKAPHKIDYKVFKDGREVDGNLLSGGIYLSKKHINIQPAGAYFSKSEKYKILTWKLGSEFMSMEGSKWKRNFVK